MFLGKEWAGLQVGQPGEGVGGPKIRPNLRAHPQDGLLDSVPAISLAPI